MTYEYKCSYCRVVFELQIPMGEHSIVTTCPHCGGSATQIIRSAPDVAYNGQWYCTKKGY